MDLSLRYIKMCEKAKQLQKEWKPKIGDFYNCEGEIFLNGFEKEKDFENFLRKTEKCFCVFKQDQLQEILNLKVIKYGLLNEIGNILYRAYKDRYVSGFAFDSFEQLWLAFVMYKKYGKIWDNKKEEWIKEEER